MQHAPTAYEILTSLAEDKPTEADYTAAYDALIRGGDCALDAFQGVYWTAKNRFLIDKPTALEVRLECPVIACGSGPSLTRSMDRLKQLNGKLPIFCAESTAPILVKNGIMPDFVCPIERTNVGIDFFADVDKEDTIFCGSYFSQSANKFDRHIVSANNGWINEWQGYGEVCASANMSGGLAALTAATISDREVFLIGMDNCASTEGATHCEGYWDDSGKQWDCEVECYDGKMRPSTDWWRVVANSVGYSLQKRGGVFQTDASTAKMPFIELGGLPNPDSVPAFDQRLKLLTPIERSVADFNQYAKHFRDDFESALAIAKKWERPEEMDTEALGGHGKNNWAIGYIMSTVIRQMSIEKMLGRGEYICDWFATAMENILDNLWVFMGEIQNEG